MWLLLTLSRLLIPLSIPRWPLFGMILAILADSFDYNLLPLKTHQDYAYYQTWDKLLDTYYLAFAAYVSFSWKDKFARRISKISFLYRLIGVSLFELTNIRLFLIFFPNFFDIFYLFYLMYTKITQSYILFPTLESISPVITAILVPKLSQEFFIHGLQQLPAQILTSTANINAPPLSPSFLILYLLQLIIFLAPPAAMLYHKTHTITQRLTQPRAHAEFQAHTQELSVKH